MLKIKNQKIYNLTPHALNFFKSDDVIDDLVNGTRRKVLKDSNIVPCLTIVSDGAVRINFDTTTLTNDTLPIIKMKAVGYTGLPDNLCPGDIIIVSGVVAGNIDFVNDMTTKGIIVCVIGDSVWDKTGKVIGALNLSRIN